MRSDLEVHSLLRITLTLLACACAVTAQQKKILVSDAAIVPQLEGVSDKVRLVPVTRDNMMKELADADAIIGDVRAEHVRAGKNLKWVQTMSAGVERVLHLSGGNDLRDSQIILTNNQIVQGPEIADHALAMLLTLSRGIPKFILNQKQELWQGRPYEGIELNGRTAVVIGVGGIGTQIAIRAHAFGMDVIGVDPEDIPYSPFLKKVVKPDQFDEVIPQADVVFVAAPHTPLSHKMVGPKQFELMKKGAYFIAVSRGGLYDLNALVQALDSRRLAGAGVDVTDPEPLPKGHALWKFENAIITPHIAGRSDKDRARMVGTIRENIRRFADGKPLINVVDKQKGY
jgi:phosphoglycerate dehydrogenase-like enzyme